MGSISVKMYNEEIRELFIKRCILLHRLGIIFFPLFSLLDFLVTRSNFLTFLLWRLLFSSLLTVNLLWIKKKHSYSHTLLLTFIGYLTGGAIISLMCRVGELGTIYYGGIILMMIGASGLLPISVKQAIVSGLALYSVYISIILSAGMVSPLTLQTLFNNSFFFLSFIIVTSVLCLENSKARLRQFQLRTNIISLGNKLSRRTANLQSSIDTRMREIEESNIRYRYLYDKINDFVVLINQKGEILLANNCFNQKFNYGDETSDKTPFFNTVHTDDLPVVKKEIITRLHDVHSVSGIEFRLRINKHEIVEVECNARRIQSNSNLNGYQLVMRDISARKTMQRELTKSQNQIAQARMATILGLARLAEYRDEDTGAHLERMREYARILAEELSTWPAYQSHITKTYIEDIYYASILHDIGKVGIPDAILFKQGKLTEEEFSIMKKHSLFGGEVLETVATENAERSFLTLGKEIAYFHHEKWDGSGYPNGLQAEAIPLSATIVALADVYDALTSKRCYKPPFSHNKAREIILQGKGKHFAPDIVDAFLNRESDFIQTRTDILIQSNNT